MIREEYRESFENDHLHYLSPTAKSPELKEEKVEKKGEFTKENSSHLRVSHFLLLQVLHFSNYIELINEYRLSGLSLLGFSWLSSVSIEIALTIPALAATRGGG